MQRDRNDQSHRAWAWLEEDPTPHQKVHQPKQLSSRQFSAVLKGWSKSYSWIPSPRRLGNSGDGRGRRRRHVREQRQGGVQHPGGPAVLLRGPRHRSVTSRMWEESTRKVGKTLFFAGLCFVAFFDACYDCQCLFQGLSSTRFETQSRMLHSLKQGLCRAARKL